MNGAVPIRVEHSVPFADGVAAAWQALADSPRVMAALPAATLSSFEGGVAEGRIKIRFGALNPTYRGTARVVERNGRAHRFVLELRGQEVRGSGSVSAIVTASAHRFGNAAQLRVEAEVEFTGRPGELGEDKQRDAAARIIEQFADRLSQPHSGGDVVADQPAEDAQSDDDAPRTGRKRPRPTPTGGDEPPVVGPIEASAPQPPEHSPDEPPSGPGAAADDEPAIESAAEPIVTDAGLGDSTPSFGTPGGIPVPTLSDEPSVNGHSRAPQDDRAAESPLARSTRQAMAKRIAPVALGIVIVLAAARRRRGKNA